MTINYQLLSEYLKAWKKLVGKQDGKKLESFGSSQYLKEKEGYKRQINGMALSYLDYSNWKPEDIGSGKIAHKLIKAIELPNDRDIDNNLVYTSRHSHSEAGSPIRKIKEVVDQNQSTKLELVLYNLFHQKQTDKKSFQQLIDIIGKRYSVISYIFFLKNLRRYVPVAPRNFEQKLAKIGANLKLSHQCSWENYHRLLEVLKEIQAYLKEYLSDGEIYLIDAHSFVWMLD
ncbi:MAG: hypothetical protein GF381_04110, partial [Candidatus Pacebacteria bacterium]|nr:hypothetical protein [Candidatus Paceibacterota bacterium]